VSGEKGEKQVAIFQIKPIRQKEIVLKLPVITQNNDSNRANDRRFNQLTILSQR